MVEVPIRTHGDRAEQTLTSTELRTGSQDQPRSSDAPPFDESGDGLQDSLKFLLGDAIVRAIRPSKDTLLLPKRLLSILLEYRGRSRPSRAIRTEAPLARSVPSVKAGKIEDRVEREFELFMEHVRSRKPRHSVVMYGGTTFIQNLRANRPIRLAKAFVDLEVPVLFNFHRWRAEDHVPPYSNKSLFQSPTDCTPKLVMKLLGSSFPETRWVFFVSYPHPSVARLINQANVRGWATIYDCRDDWEEFQKVGAARWYDRAVEEYVVSNCDITSCVSETLRTKMMALSPSSDIRLSPNAFDPEFIVPGHEKETEGPVRVGYFGHLTPQWFDWDSVIWLARNRPDFAFEIVGHAAPPNLSLPENISLLGPQESGEICRLASKWRVAIIPFKMNRLADSVDPIKIYEYLGLQLPVVSFRMPQITNYPHTRVVGDRKSFLAALDAAVEEEVDTRVVSEFLAKNTWECRAREFLGWADTVLQSQDCIKALDPLDLARILRS